MAAISRSVRACRMRSSRTSESGSVCSITTIHAGGQADWWVDVNDA